MGFLHCSDEPSWSSMVWYWGIVPKTSCYFEDDDGRVDIFHGRAQLSIFIDFPGSTPWFVVRQFGIWGNSLERYSATGIPTRSHEE